MFLEVEFVTQQREVSMKTETHLSAVFFWLHTCYGGFMPQEKIREISKLILDIGKIIFTAAVVGFFVPGFSGEVGILGFTIGATTSFMLFAIGIKLTA